MVGKEGEDGTGSKVEKMREERRGGGGRGVKVGRVGGEMNVSDEERQ